MKLLKKNLTVCLILALVLSLAACGQSAAPAAPSASGQAAASAASGSGAEADVTVRLAALKGPTAMGLVYLEEQSPSGGSYEMTLAASADEVTPALIKGDLDAACVPANLAAVLYSKTEGQVVTLGINTLGVLYIVEHGNAVQSIQDLAGKTVVAAGKGSTPEYALRYLLKENGLDPDSDVVIDWKSEHSECVSALATGAATVALLPQPFVTVAQTKIDGLRIALDLTEEWDALNNGSALLTGVVVARKAFVEEHPAAVEAFLRDYARSVEKVNADPAAAAEKVSALGIIESAAVAEKALPYCNIVCITGQEMAAKLSGYLQVLFDAEPASVGGKLPGGDFYYGA